MPLPEEAPWWEIFSCTTDQLIAVVTVLHELYSRPKATYINVSKDPQPPTKPPTAATTPETAMPDVPDSSQLQGVTGVTVSQSQQPTGMQAAGADGGEAASALNTAPGAADEATSTDQVRGLWGLLMLAQRLWVRLLAWPSPHTLLHAGAMCCKRRVVVWDATCS